MLLWNRFTVRIIDLDAFVDVAQLHLISLGAGFFENGSMALAHNVCSDSCSSIGWCAGIS